MILDFETLYLYTIIKVIEKDRKIPFSLLYKKVDEYVLYLCADLKLTESLMIFFNNHHKIMFNSGFDWEKLNLQYSSIKIHDKILNCIKRKNLQIYGTVFCDNFEYDEVVNILNIDEYDMKHWKKYINKSKFFNIEKEFQIKGNLTKLLMPLCVEK
jgi:hypothetical protein